MQLVESRPCTKHARCLMARSSRWQSPTRVMHSESERCFAIARATERAIRGWRLGANRFRPKSDGFICGRHQNDTIRCTAAFQTQKYLGRWISYIPRVVLRWFVGPMVSYLNGLSARCHGFLVREARAAGGRRAVEGEERELFSSGTQKSRQTVIDRSALRDSEPGRPWFGGKRNLGNRPIGQL